MARIIKNTLGNFLVICLIFLMMTVWIFSGWPRIWQKPPVPSEVKIVKANPDTEIKKPTTSILDSGTVFTNPENAYDLPDTGGDESTNADQYNAGTGIYRWHTWATKGQTYTATVLKIKWNTSGGFSDDHFAIEATKDGTNWNLVLVVDGVHNETAIQTAQVSLDTDQDLTQVQVRVNHVKVAGGDKDSLYIYDIWTEGTYTPPAVSISLVSPETPGSVAFEALALEATEDTTSSGINDVERISVDIGPAKLEVRSTTFSDGTYTWSLGTTNGSKQVKWEFSPNGTAWTTFAVAETLYLLNSSVPQGNTQDLYFKITMPTATDSYDQYSSTVTVVASVP